MEHAEGDSEVHDDQYGDEMYEEQFAEDEGKAEIHGNNEITANELQKNSTELEEDALPEQQLFDVAGETEIAGQDYLTNTETGGAAVHEEVEEGLPDTTENPSNVVQDVNETGNAERDISSLHEDDVQEPLADGVSGSPSRQDNVLDSSSLVGDKPSDAMLYADADQPDLERRSELALMSGIDGGQFDPDDTLEEQPSSYHPADEHDSNALYQRGQMHGSPEVPTPPPLLFENEDTLPVKDDTSPSILVSPDFYNLY
jgi:hypothetical protein